MQKLPKQDGNSPENTIDVMSAASNGNYAGAVFLQHAHRFTFTRVEARRYLDKRLVSIFRLLAATDTLLMNQLIGRYNGDGFSFQVCDDIHFFDCTAEDCFGLGFHPGIQFLQSKCRPRSTMHACAGDWQ